jgi:ABC-type lipoprotein export system ATPase subunit
MSEPSGNLGDQPETSMWGQREPHKPPAGTETPGLQGPQSLVNRNEEISWREDPSVAVAPKQSRSVFRLPKLRENRDGNTAMTEPHHQLAGVSADRVSVVLQAGHPTLVALTRSQAIDLGYTVLDPDPDVMATLLAEQGVVLPVDLAPQGLGPLESIIPVTPGMPMVGPEGDEEQFRTNSVEGFAAELNKPVLKTTDTSIAHAAPVIPTGHFSVGDAQPAVKQSAPWGVEPPAVLDRNEWNPQGAGWPTVEDVASRLRNEANVDQLTSTPPSDSPTEAVVVVPSGTPMRSIGAESTLVPLLALESDHDIPTPSWVVFEPAHEPAVDETVVELPVVELPVAELPAVEFPAVESQATSTRPHLVLVDSDDDLTIPDWSTPPAEVVQPSRPTLVELPKVTELPRPLELEPPVEFPPIFDAPNDVTIDVLDAVLRDTEAALGATGELTPVAVVQVVSTAVPTISAIKLNRTLAGPLGPIPVLHDVSLDLAPGDLLVVRGSSGAGATTLLQCLAGFDTPDSGKIFINGEEMGTWSEADRARFRAASAGFIPQGHELVDDLNARDNVALPLLAAGWNAKAAQTEATRQLERFALQDRLFFFPSQLSYSERARVAVARALAGDPFVVWADDPTAGLDDDHSALVIHSLVEHHQRGATVLVISRDERFVVTTARVAKLDAGRLEVLDLGSLAWGNPGEHV